MGESARDKQSGKVTQNLNNLYGDIQKQSFQVGNRFNNFNPEFGTTEMRGNLDDIFNRNKSLIDTEFNSQAAKIAKGTGARLASQGITGGSVLNQAVNSGVNEAGKGKYNALVQLGINRAGQEGDLMNRANDNQFRTTNAAQSVDIQNVLNTLQKYGMLSGNLGQQMSNLQNVDDTTWMDVLGQIAGTGAQAAATYYGG